MHAVKVLGIAAALGASLLAGGPAAAASDTTRPTLKTPIKASFLVPSQLGDEAWDEDCLMYATTAAQTFTWRSTDNSGWVAFDVEGYAVDGYLDESEYGLTTRSYTSERTGNAYSCGEGDWEPLSWWDVTARDRAGNATTKSVGGAVFQLYQEDGSNVPNDYYEGDQVTVAYTGTWAGATCACWSAGATRKTTTRGSAVTFTVPVSTEEQAAHVGLVMHRGPSRGAARIIVDGVTVATVDTGATSELPKSIVWQTALKPGTHTVKVVNLATTGRTRIDIDALLVN